MLLDTYWITGVASGSDEFQIESRLLSNHHIGSGLFHLREKVDNTRKKYHYLICEMDVLPSLAESVQNLPYVCGIIVRSERNVLDEIIDCSSYCNKKAVLLVKRIEYEKLQNLARRKGTIKIGIGEMVFY